ncbi:glycosyltransferase family 4 protein [Micromonospora sp. HUAS LYJ1]|uniref:glycosyltransferase family 4 protein n=1 Tax=Micromonospora sp. HUAS LYJ1 TaxID=3061626 RepID=UPI002671FC54|nr:glycosyltransferase family 4 protein [Micromonospora sp. HUAS LYJ1]WKU04963.1 glycosyltransferase family 4 protein [Micromonospora sp. HUAS LYJ1]
MDIHTSPATPGPVVLAVATEWFSACGGLSTFNRGLCIGLAACGATALCVVPAASEEERRHATAHGVTLLTARRVPGMSTRHVLSRRPNLPAGLTPDIVIGHGRITGAQARILVEDHFPTAARLHLVHMDPDELEWWRDGQVEDAGERADSRARIEWELACSATHVVAVGPRLHALWRRDLSVLPGKPEPLRVDPGLDPFDDGPRTPPPGEPVQLLLYGRMADYRIKGVDLAAQAVAHARTLLPADAPDVELLVRGAPPGESGPLRDRILAWAGDGGLRVTVRPFTTDAEHLRQDLRRATVVIMPSRAESFGLAGTEAIAAGTPALVSDRSGLGMMLRELLPGSRLARAVVPVGLRPEDDVVRWAHRIAAVLVDRDSAFLDAAHLRRSVAALRTWRGAARGLLDAVGDGSTRLGGEVAHRATVETRRAERVSPG